MRELIWIVFAALVLFTPAAPARANHVIQHNIEYCIGLGQYFYPEIVLAKALDVKKERYLHYAETWMKANVMTTEVIAPALADISRMWDAADHGDGVVVQCIEAAQKPNPQII